MNGANKVTVGWVIGVAIVLLLIGLSIYTGYGKHPSEKTPSAVTQPQQNDGLRENESRQPLAGADGFFATPSAYGRMSLFPGLAYLIFPSPPFSIFSAIPYPLPRSAFHGLAERLLWVLLRLSRRGEVRAAIVAHVNVLSLGLEDNGCALEGFLDAAALLNMFPDVFTRPCATKPPLLRGWRFIAARPLSQSEDAAACCYSACNIDPLSRGIGVQN